MARWLDLPQSAGADHSQPRRQTYGEESKEGSEEDRAEESQGCPFSGSRKMNFTRSQLHERITDLSGMLRAAQENKRLTAEKRVEQDRLTALARQADEKADEQLADVIEQLRDANRQYADAVEEIIAPPAPAQFTTEEINAPGFWNPAAVEGADFQAQAIQNGMDRIGEALDAARS